jgi:hypothetical protein
MSDAVDERHAGEAGTDDNPAIKKAGSLNHLKPFTNSRTTERGKGPARPTFQVLFAKILALLKPVKTVRRQKY